MKKDKNEPQWIPKNMVWICTNCGATWNANLKECPVCYMRAQQLQIENK